MAAGTAGRAPTSRRSSRLRALWHVSFSHEQLSLQLLGERRLILPRAAGAATFTLEGVRSR